MFVGDVCSTVIVEVCVEAGGSEGARGCAFLGAKELARYLLHLALVRLKNCHLNLISGLEPAPFWLVPIPYPQLHPTELCFEQMELIL